MHRHFLPITCAFLLLAMLPRPAAAGPQEDLAFEVKDAGSQSGSLVVGKLMTLKLGATCWKAVLDKKQRARELISAYASNITAYAKAVTGDDWGAISMQEANRAQLVKLVGDFGSRFHLTLNVEGDDCGATGDELWLRYLSVTTTALKDYPPASGKAFITINVTSKAKGVTTDVSSDGTKFTITGARDLVPGVWSDNIAKPFKRVSSKK